MLPFPHAGEAAALAVSLLWATGSLLFTYTSGRVGALATNVLRLTIAALALATLHVASGSGVWPREASGHALALLALSGIIGLVIGDFCFFRSLLLVGPRRATLLFSLSPVATAILGRLWLGETLGARALAAIGVTLAGTAWVVTERSATWPGASRTLAGSLYGAGAALGQALGLVLSKAAAAGLSALSMAHVRMAVAVIVVWGLAIASGRAPSIAAEARKPRVVLPLAAAACVGPICGMWLSLWAVAHTETAVAATLMALVPVMVIPIMALVHRERPTIRAVVGAFVAVAGVALLVTR